MRAATKAECLLLMITVIWGATFPLMQIVVHTVSPAVFVFFRFALAACVLLPFVCCSMRKTTPALLLFGMTLGLINAGIYIAQTTGLETISAPRAAFITGASVVIVPFLLPLARLGFPSRMDLCSAVLCLVGLYLLTGANLKGLHIGDFWELLGAILTATGIVYIQWITPRCRSYQLLTFYQILFTLPPAFLFAQLTGFSLTLTLPLVGVLLFCGLLATALVLFVQVKYQQFTSAPKAALIYALEPVFAVIITRLMGHSPISVHTLIGGSVMLSSIVLVDVIKIVR